MTTSLLSRVRPDREALLGAAAVLFVLLPGASASAQPTRQGDPVLSPRVLELAKPAVSLAPAAAQARRIGLAARGPASLMREGDRILAEVRFEHGAAAGLPALRDAGAKIVHFSQALGVVTVAAEPAVLAALADVPNVAGVTEVLTPVTAASCAGAAVSEGDAQLGAAAARDAFGVDGSGVTVGILSDSFDRDSAAPTHAFQDVASGDLPGPGNACGRPSPVALLDDSYLLSDASDEGRAMAQIVHDLAPGANIAFATAFKGEASFAANIRALADTGATVIADDVFYFEEPFFQDGPVAVAASEVAGRGVSYFSAAGNDNVRAGGRDLGSWEAPAFRDASLAVPPAGCPAALPGYANNCMDFDPALGATDTTFAIEVQSGETVRVDLQWAQPWNGVSTDLDSYLVSGSTLLTPTAGGEIFNVASTQKPVEVLSWKNTGPTPQTVELAISRCDEVCDPDNGGDSAFPRLKFILIGGGTPAEYLESSGGDTVGRTIFGHAAAEGAIAAGAVRFNNSAQPEPFSSRGPVKHYFGPVTSSAPAPPIGEKVIPKPDLAATDGGANTFFGSFQGGVWRFFGTSAAAPHAAAVAALLRQANPTASTAQIRSTLIATADPVGVFGPDAVGAGLVNARDAVAALVLPRPSATSAGTVQPAPAGSEAPDRRRPVTTIVKHPRSLIRTPSARIRVVFRFAADEPGATFLCRIDRRPRRACGPRLSRSFGPGSHLIRVQGRDRAGNVDQTPAVFRFRVKRVGS